VFHGLDRQTAGTGHAVGLRAVIRNTSSVGAAAGGMQQLQRLASAGCRPTSRRSAAAVGGLQLL